MTHSFVFHDSFTSMSCVAMCCSVLQCVAVCCSVLQCVAVFCSATSMTLQRSVLQCVAVCCSVFHDSFTGVTRCVFIRVT